MAKLSYGIPTSLDASVLDMEIPLQNKDGIGFKSVPLKVVMGWLLSFIILMTIWTQSFIGNHIGTGIIFSIIWGLLTCLFLKVDSSRRIGIQLVIPFIKYLDKGNRKIKTRRSHHYLPFLSILNLTEDLVEKDGLIKFADGRFGYCYRVVGSASILLFDRDQDMIIDRVDKYFRKVDTNVEHLFLGTKESQLVHHQLMALKIKLENLEADDPDIRYLLLEQKETLVHYVGGRYKSVQQYMLIMGENRNALAKGVAVLRGEVDESTAMIRQCSVLWKDEVMELFKEIYS